MIGKLWVLLIVSMMLNGCAVWNKDIMTTEQVWQATSIGEVSLQNLKTFTAVSVPMNPKWIGDGLGAVAQIDEDGKEVQKVEKRKVWTALVCDARKCEPYPAVINKFGTRLFVLGLGKSKADFEGKDYVVLSGSRRFGMTRGMLKGKFSGPAIVSLAGIDIINDAKKRADFFWVNDSKISSEMLIDMDPETQRGREYIAKLQAEFPQEVVIDGHLVRTSADFATFKSLVGQNNRSTMLLKILDSSNLSLSLQSIAMPYLELVRFTIVASYAAFDDTLRGSFFEAQVTGAQAGDTLSEYLLASGTEVERLITENNRLYRLLEGERRKP